MGSILVDSDDWLCEVVGAQTGRVSGTRGSLQRVLS